MTLFSGGAVVTMDPTIGDLASGDVLISGDRIVAVGTDLRSHPEAAGATVVDTTGGIVCPGFVDTHRHAWQAQLRRSIPDVGDLGEYVMSTLAGVAPAYTPNDMYVGTRLAALTALDAGITTMLDFSHNSRTAAHSDAAVQALVDTGIRGVHASMGPHFGDWDKQWPADLVRLREKFHGANDALVTVRLAALATDEIAGSALAYGPELAALARDLGIGVSIDAVFGEFSSAAIESWATAGLLGPDVTLIHATGLTGQAWQTIGATGTTVSLAPTSEAQIGLETAVPAIDEALAVGVRPGLSIDVEVALASDMFTQMRALHAIQRMRAVHAAYGTDHPVGQRITTRDVLDFATAQGARTNGLGDVTGSISPGKQADLLVVRADDVNTMPLNDAVGTLVLGADARNIDTVVVGGRVRKAGGRLVDVDVDIDELRRTVTASRDAIRRRVAG
ncbi:amidohydrolase family protein [Solwaraspora sp. WMMA2080]|uniref:amidohydrolase family protein n=1 Tax=unclassified Solwaraspora TaxID=2627926 RepID=UPI00248B2C01|nr:MULTISPECIES: amidohydrolase family protein [unclassified Solwaraspora]WBB95198.1 amidohydrolase family protein [Solwaraspora sp. WMMA2059]WBC20896.1 amidohydrolase family protein [Solwaraspora sp. WMMA2080]